MGSPSAGSSSAVLLLGDLVGVAQFGLGDGENGLLDLGHIGRLVVARLLGGLLGETDDGLDHRLEVLVAEHYGAEHHVFRQFLGLGLDHEHGIGRAGDHEVKRGLVHLLQRRVQLVLTADIADASRAHGTHEGNAREGESGGCRHHADDVRIVLEIVREHGHDNLGVVLVALDEEGADRAVDEAGDQGLLLGRTAFALEIAARDATSGVGALLVVHREREEVETGLRLLGRHDGGENGGLTVGGDDGAVGLAGHLARLEHELAAGPDQFFALSIEHV
ncbi:MAG: hypothetical protein K0Q60_5039 [Microvirga sp.]|nr:hypothetical protein [Microvirga sp.]